MKSIKIIAIALALGIIFSFTKSPSLQKSDSNLQTQNLTESENNLLSFVCFSSDKEWG